MAFDDIKYVEDDYVVAGYVEVIKPSAAFLSNYIEDQDDYVDTGYVRNQSGEFTLVADTTVTIAEADAALTSTATLSATPIRIINDAANLIGLPQLTVTSTRVRPFESDFDSIASTVTAAAKVGGTLADLSSNFQLSADAISLKGADAAIEARAIILPLAIRVPSAAALTRPLSAYTDSLTYSTTHRSGNYAAAIESGVDYVEYYIGAEQYFNPAEEWFCQFEVQLQPSASQPTNPVYEFFRITSSTNGIHGSSNAQLRLYQAGSNLVLTSGGTTLGSTTSRPTDSAFSSIAIVYDTDNGGEVDVYVEGVLRISVTNVGISSLPATTTAETILTLGAASGSNGGLFYMDEFRIVQGSSVISDYGITFSPVNNPSGSLYDASGWSDSTETGILLHFEQTSDDVGTEFASASISAAATVSATATKVHDTSASLSAEFTGVFATEITHEADANLASNFQTTADNLRTRDLDSAVSAQTSVSATGVLTRETDATVNSLATTQIDAGKIHDAGALIFTETSKVTVAIKVGEAVADLASTFTSTQIGVKTAGAVSAITSTSTTTSTAVAILGADSAVTSNTTTSATIERVRFADATLAVSATLTATGSDTDDFSADLTSAFSVGATIDNLVKEGAASVSSAATTAITGAALRDTSANLPVVASTITAAVETDAFSANLTSTSTVTCDAEKLFGFGAQLIVLPILNATATKIHDAQSTMSTDTTVVANGGKLQVAFSTHSAIFGISATATILHIDQFVYIIPAENRTASITAESREHTIVFEDREYLLEG